MAQSSIHIDRMAVNVYRDDRACPGRDLLLDQTQDRGSRYPARNRWESESLHGDRSASAVAMLVHALTRTSSPGPIPAAATARWRAVVPLDVAMPCLHPQYRANSSSNDRKASPNDPEISPRRSAADHRRDVIFSNLWFEYRNHRSFTFTRTLSFSVPRKGPCFTEMHCMSSMTRMACVP